MSRKQQRRQLSRLQRGRCAYCGRPMHPDQTTLDHVFPLSRGGSSGRGNLVLSCRPCNQRKGARTPAEAGMRLIPRAVLCGLPPARP